MDAPLAMAIVEGLESFTGRGAGSDAERRAANWLAREAEILGRGSRIETFWCRPNWALAHAWHVALAVGGSLITLASPVAGIAILAVALASVICDAITGVSLGRRLTPERASQNVIVSASGSAPNTPPLILTANYDAGRTGLAYRLRPATARLVALLRGLTPGWLGWLSTAILWLEAVAVLRELGHTSRVIGALQFPPTVALILGLALLLELATGSWSPAAGDNATGVAAALEVADALFTAPPKHLRLEVALTGAGDGGEIGLRHHIRGLRGRRPTGHTRRSRHDSTPRPIVVAVSACAGGDPHWWESDGALIPLGYTAALRRIAARTAIDESYLRISPHRGRGSGGAGVARAAGLASITVGCLGRSGAPERSHQQTDRTAAVDPQAVDRAIQLTLLLVDGIDAVVGETSGRSTATPA